MIRSRTPSAEFRGVQSQTGARALLIGPGGGWSSADVLLLEDPSLSLTSQNGTSILRSGTRELRRGRDYLVMFEEILNQGYIAVGYLGYEFFQSLQPDFKRSPGKNGQVFPDASFMFFEEGKLKKKKIEEWREDLNPMSDHRASQVPRPNMTKTKFVQMVERARQYIAKGDIYQVNLSQRFEVPFEIPPELFLSKLYQAQPVPFACCFDFGEFQLLSGSMELFLRKSGRQLTTRPIKGTRRRGLDEREDQGLKRELLESEKERAENLMIVDLMRNDLGRVCEFSSVRVEDLFKVEQYSTLYQMVSEVSGKLRDGVTVEGIIRNTFPPGSVTGAPKRRAMEIIDELEPHIRGPYCGAIGLFMPNGDFTMSVAIRILAASRGMGTFWVGGGIMWDSVPELEHEETLVKAQAIMKALA